MSRPSRPTGPRLRIAAASDLHYGEQGTDYELFTQQLIDRLNAVHARTPLDLVVLNGDLAHAPDWLAPLRRRLDALEPPYVVVQGNHDGATEQQWRDLWGHGFNHSRALNGVRLVVAGTSDAPGRYLCADQRWLADALGESDGAPVIVAMHITPITWTRWGIDCPDTTRLLEQHANVVAVLNGHDHDEFGMKMHEGVPYLFDSHAGGHWGTDFRGFRVIELFDDGGMDTWVTDGSTTFHSASLPPR